MCSGKLQVGIKIQCQAWLSEDHVLGTKKVRDFFVVLAPLTGSMCWVQSKGILGRRLMLDFFDCLCWREKDTQRYRPRERELKWRHRCAHTVTEDRWCWSMLYLCWVFWHSPASVLQLSTGPTCLLMFLSVGTYMVWITPHPWNSKFFFFSPHDHPIQLFLSFCSRLVMCVGSNIMSSTTIDVCL